MKDREWGNFDINYGENSIIQINFSVWDHLMKQIHYHQIGQVEPPPPPEPSPEDEENKETGTHNNNNKTTLTSIIRSKNQEDRRII